jgi:cell division protein FtsA
MTDQTITGIDVGSSKIATVIAKISAEENTPRIMGFAQVPSRGVKKGQIVDINLVTTAIEECVNKAERMAGMKVANAYVSVSGSHISSLNSHGIVAVAHPEIEITSEDISRAIEAAKAISLSSTREVIEVLPREFVVDGQNSIKNPLGMNGVRLEVNTHIITAGVVNLKNLDRSLHDLGIEREKYVFSGLASSAATLSDTDKELGVVLVDIGGGKTDICIYSEGALSYSSSIPYGARHITNDIAVGLRISLESAEKLKLFLVDTGSKSNVSREEIDVTNLNLIEGISKISFKTVVDAIMKPRLEEIFEKVFAEIDKSEFSQQVPSGLVITGGGALTLGTVSIAKKVVGLPARIGIPQGVTGLVDEVLYPQYATVVGLLLYGRDEIANSEKGQFKDFGQILRNVNLKGSTKKFMDMIKSFMP